MNKYKLKSIAIELNPDSDSVADIRALWNDVFHGNLKLGVDDFTHVYGVLEYDDDLKRTTYTITVLSDSEIERLSSGGYEKFTATSTKSASDASDAAWEKARSASNPDCYGDLEHFIDNPDGTFTCEVYISVDTDNE